MEKIFKTSIKSPYFKPMKKALKVMEKQIDTFLKAEEPLLSETSVHLLQSGGKRLRPIFVFLGGYFGNYDEEKLIPLAAAMEITHMATLVHDDVVDNALLRRNHPTVKACWGNEISVFTGDFLLAKAMKLISSFQDDYINKRLSEIALEMCKGELSQMAGAYGLNTDIDTYLLRIRQKTALLLSASCELGAYVAHAEPAVVARLCSFGSNLGMAFQVTDDILDYLPDGGKFGKALGGDIRQGIPTLPLLYTLRHSDKSDDIRRIFPQREKSRAELQFILDEVSACGGIDYAKSVSEKFTESAKDDLKALPHGDARDSFLELADLIMKRKY